MAKIEGLENHSLSRVISFYSKTFFLNGNIEFFRVESAKSKTNATKYYELTIPGKLICGGLTAVVAQTITYPLDVVRRHMQLVTMFKDSAVRQ